MLRDQIDQLRQKRIGDLAVDRFARLTIDSQHLMRMPMLCATDESLFGRGGTGRVGEQTLRANAGRLEQFPHVLPVAIRADDAGDRRFGVETAKHVGDVGRSAEPNLLPLFAKQDDRRFLADAFGVAPDVAVRDGSAGISDLAD